MQLFPFYWKLKVHKKFGVHITLVEFHLPSTVTCNQGAVLLGYFRDIRDVKYCGKRAPWTMAYRLPYVYVTVLASQINKIPYGFYFKLLYEANDRESSIINILYKKTYIGNSQFTFPMSGNQYTKPRLFTQTYHFMALVYQVICVWLSHNKDIKLYDGPGPLSKAVNITQEHLGDVCFSRFIGYAEILKYNVSLRDIPYGMINSESNTLGLCEKSIGDDNRSLHFTARDTGGGVHCSWTMDRKFDEMQIHHISFQGFDMFSFYSSTFSLVSVGICQYGGLHVLFEDEYRGDIFDPFPLCNNIYNRPKILLPIRRKIKRAYVIFTTFDQYSTGHMEVALMHFPECELYTTSWGTRRCTGKQSQKKL